MRGGIEGYACRREAFMEKIFRVGLAAAVLMAVLAGWHSYRDADDPSPFRQIMIHGTPVCVFQDGEDILARIGQCPGGPDGERDIRSRSAPFHGQPRMELPPGHPPVDDKHFSDERRTIPI